MNPSSIDIREGQTWRTRCGEIVRVTMRDAASNTCEVRVISSKRVTKGGLIRLNYWGVMVSGKKNVHDLVTLMEGPKTLAGPPERGASPVPNVNADDPEVTGKTVIVQESTPGGDEDFKRKFEANWRSE